MSAIVINTKKLDEIYEEWRGNKSCYDSCKPVFDSAEMLDFAEYCLKHEANYKLEPNKAALSQRIVSCTTCAYSALSVTSKQCKGCVDWVSYKPK